ncbi:O-antigen ligase family protein [Acidithiobacillus ferridurans]|uniref:O-antigen ligase family protein n=1 Tax=Acidithiobacillus ferridurans TaxID=1232575 RepID=UPI0011BE13B7|nr:O-antigen ligase family protein [Acidithiobacillus ferridurans]
MNISYELVGVNRHINCTLGNATKQHFGTVGVLFIMYMAISLILPSGSVGPLNIKFIVLFIVLTLLIATRPVFRSKFLLTVLLIFSACIFWFFLGVVKTGSVAMSLSQFKAVAITFLLPILSFYLLSRNIISDLNIYKAILYSTVFISSIKVFLLVYSAVTGLNFIDITFLLAKYFHAQIMTMKIAPFIYRFELPADLAGPLALFILLLRNRLNIDLRINIMQKMTYAILIIFSVFISYSRYIWAMTAVVAIIAFMFSRRIRNYSFFIVLAFLLSAIFYHPYFRSLTDRFFSHAVTVSDNIRLHELPYLLRYFETSPIFGHGLGAYVPSCIRDAYDKYSYEIQWGALLMQIGIVGIAAVCAALSLIAYPFICCGINKIKLALLILLALWLSASFFNPYLTSSAAGVIFSFFVAAGYSVRNNTASNRSSRSIE